ncbi:DUF4139 domain-containing protein [uncultured Tateyamaria sp.]|uniref:DUF4139 domain-containing protein n=1 Tax=uncultured Tateyamaria sp. TaxID=455651 RepID=UPI002619AF9C|nr:DUF4139 domain-containing protein [uncultured Tateyamaria sp.]
MRLLTLALLLCPLPGLADDITLNAPPVAVTAYASGAQITRRATFDLPEGQHTLRIADMNPNILPEAIDIRLQGAVVTSRQWTQAPDQPYRAPRTPAWLAAKEARDQAAEALAARDDQIALTIAKGEAAQDQIAFLNGIDLPDEAGTDVDTLRAIGQLIASDGTAARAAIRAAEAEARALRADRADLEFALREAEAALRAVTPSNTQPAALTLNVTAEQAGTATLELNYISDFVQWAPTYRVVLAEDDTLTIVRGASVTQSSTEDWNDVSLTLSTLSPFEGSAPGTLRPLRRRIIDPKEEAETFSRLRAQSGVADMAAPIAEAPVILEEATATADFSGVGVSYTLPGTVSIPAQSDAVQIALDTLDFDATLTARAVPMHDDTAYRLVKFENTSPEILLPGEALLYVGTQLVGATDLDALPPNDTADIFFGRIEGLRLTRTVLDRNEGDRGIITRSNEQREDVRIDIENLTARTWDVTLRDAVPFSEQEDLVIEWRATPPPNDTAVDDRRGILEWDLTLAAGETQSIALQTELRWPEGMILR